MLAVFEFNVAVVVALRFAAAVVDMLLFDWFGWSTSIDHSLF